MALQAPLSLSLAWAGFYFVFMIVYHFVYHFVYCSIAMLFPEETARARVMGHVLGGIALGVVIGDHYCLLRALACTGYSTRG